MSYATFDGAFHVSVTAGRVKHRNLERDPRAGLYVGLGDFHRWVVLEGEVTFADIPTHPDDEGAVLLRKVYETIAGPHPDWDEFDQVMIEDRRRVISLHPERAYGMLP